MLIAAWLIIIKKLESRQMCTKIVVSSYTVIQVINKTQCSSDRDNDKDEFQYPYVEPKKLGTNRYML